MQKPTMPFPSPQVWSNQAKFYEANTEDYTLPPLISLANMMELQKSQDILEVGCATGTFSLFLLRTLTNTKTFISSDAADGMVARAIEKKDQTEGFNKNVQHEFKVLNAEDLSPLKDESIDSYISGLVLHIVPNPEKFLQEALRVLRKGGRIGLTVPKMENIYFKIFMDSYEQVGIKSFEGEGPYYLGHKDVLIKLLQDNGFEIEFCWDDQYKVPAYTEEYVDKWLTNPKYLGLEEEKKKIVRDYAMGRFKKMRENYETFHVGLVSIIARKP